MTTHRQRFEQKSAEREWLAIAKEADKFEDRLQADSKRAIARTDDPRLIGALIQIDLMFGIDDDDILPPFVIEEE